MVILSKIIAYASNLSALPAVWEGRKQKGILWLYVLCSLLFDIISFGFKKAGINFAWSSNAFFLAEFLLLGYYFIPNLLKDRNITIAKILLVVAALFFALFTLFTTGLYQVNYVGAGYFYAAYILLSIAGLYRLLVSEEIVLLQKSPMFVFYVAILLYSAGSFIIILYENELLKTDRKFITYAWIFIRNPLNILKNMLIYYVFTLVNRSK